MKVGNKNLFFKTKIYVIYVEFGKQENSTPSSSSSSDSCEDLSDTESESSGTSDDKHLTILVDPEMFSMTEANFCILLIDWLIFGHWNFTDISLEERMKTHAKELINTPENVINYCIKEANRGYILDLSLSENSI